jgi:hypothetical protein
MRELILEHEDGRRVGCPEDKVNDPAFNPYNHPTQVFNGTMYNGAPVAVVNDPGRPVDDHLGLVDEGFVPVAYRNEQDYIDRETGNVVPRGAEIHLHDAPRFGAALTKDKEHKQTEHGKKMSEEHKQRRERLGMKTWRDVGWEPPK